MQLIEVEEEDIGEEETMRWADAHCPYLSRAFYIDIGKFASKAN